MPTIDSRPEISKCPVCGQQALVGPMALLGGKAIAVLGFAFEHAASRHKDKDARHSVFGKLDLDAAACGACGHVELVCRRPKEIKDALAQAGW